jgi:hypothetical protein
MISLEYKLYVEYMFEKVQNEKPFSWKKYYIESAEQFWLTAEKFIFLNINAVKFSIRLLRIREFIYYFNLIIVTWMLSRFTSFYFSKKLRNNHPLSSHQYSLTYFTSVTVGCGHFTIWKISVFTQYCSSEKSYVRHLWRLTFDFFNSLSLSTKHSKVSIWPNKIAWF